MVSAYACGLVSGIDSINHFSGEAYCLSTLYEYISAGASGLSGAIAIGGRKARERTGRPSFAREG